MLLPALLFTAVLLCCPPCLARRTSWPSCVRDRTQHYSSPSAPRKAEMAPEPPGKLLGMTIPLGPLSTCLYSVCSAEQLLASCQSQPPLPPPLPGFAKALLSCSLLLLAACDAHKTEVRATHGAGRHSCCRGASLQGGRAAHLEAHKSPREGRGAYLGASRAEMTVHPTSC